MRAFLTATALVLALPAMVFGGQRPSPYEKLFRGELDSASKPKPVPGAPSLTAPLKSSGQKFSATEVRCGMTVVEGDPKIDPSFAQKIPPGATKGWMKIVEPGVCGRR